MQTGGQCNSTMISDPCTCDPTKTIIQIQKCSACIRVLYGSGFRHQRAGRAYCPLVSVPAQNSLSGLQRGRQPQRRQVAALVVKNETPVPFFINQTLAERWQLCSGNVKKKPWQTPFPKKCSNPSWFPVCSLSRWKIDTFWQHTAVYIRFKVTEQLKSVSSAKDN